MAANHVLNKSQMASLAADVNNPDIGGFTIKGSGENPLVGPPTPGFLAGGIVGADNLPYPMPPEEIGKFHGRGEVQEQLTQPNKYMGGWHSEATGTSALDVSEFSPYSAGNPSYKGWYTVHGDKVYQPSTVRSHNEALLNAWGQGVERKQEAIGSFAAQADGSVNYDDDIYIEEPPAREPGKPPKRRLLTALRPVAPSAWGQ